ncbi:amidase [Sinomonas sp. JGH33]|uniref:Amidase n=1 Tax=Sinomonas terricola TaxID=3110330 RepID=A0ABU5T8Q0_9MICC|nr:amidase [Sinomonas sp. JGH33]MEA5455900.1 amidase [Sinomonas sp. JGH33]
MDPAVGRLSALALRDALRSGELSARHAVGHYLEAIDGVNRHLGAFVTVTAERALEDAAAADAAHAAARRAGTLDALPPLHGMPTAFKDLVDIEGVPTTHGSAAIEHRAAPSDGPLVALLRAAGAISLGKTQVPEFGLTAYSENRVAPASRNPHAPAHSSGGSSGGSAAAVAAGLLPFAPGTDGGGSIRIPAAACGIVGLKPGRGLIAAGRSAGDAARLVVAGPLAPTADDAALLLDALVGSGGGHPGVAGHGGRHAASYVDAARREPGRQRIGVALASPWDQRYRVRPEPDALAALTAAIARLEAAGHLVEEASVRYDNRYPDAFTAAWTASVGSLRIAPEREPLLTPLTRAFRRRAQQRSRSKLDESLAFLRSFEHDTVAQYTRWDVMLMPALAQTPRPVGWFSGAEWQATADEDYARQCEFAPWSSMVNVCGLPAVSVPTHWTEAGLPMGVQLVASTGSEGLLLALARLLERPHARRDGQ